MTLLYVCVMLTFLKLHLLVYDGPVPDYPCGKCGKCHGPRASRGPRGVGKFSQDLRVSEDVQCCPMSTGPCQSLHYISVARAASAGLLGEVGVSLMVPVPTSAATAVRK